MLLLALTSQTQPLSVVDDYGENLLAQRISTINGVAQVQVYGSQQYAVRVQLDPNQLATRGIALTDVEQAIGNANVNLPTGTLYGRDRATSVQATGQLNNAADYEPMIVAYRNGAPVRLDADRHACSTACRTTRSPPGTTARAASCSPSSGSPARTRSRSSTRSSRSCRRSEAQLPPSIKLAMLYDRSQSIRESVRDVQLTLLLRAGAGGRRDLRVPAQRLGDAHPEPRAAAVDHRHVRGDVRASATASTTCR